MAWAETEQNLFQRPLGLTENMMASGLAADQPLPRESIKIHTEVYFAAPHPSELVLQAFKDAWKALRLLKSPDVATSYGNGQKTYKVPSSQELEAWIKETFVVTETGTSMQELIKSLQLLDQSLPRCYMLPEATADDTFQGSMMIWISHWRAEATGTLRMVNQLFDFANDLLNGTSTKEALSRHVSGNEVSLLTPALEDMMMPNLESTSEATARIDKLFADFQSHLPAVDYPTEGEPTAATSTYKIYQRTYTPTSTSSLVQACRKAGITVTAAVHSAFIGAVWNIAAPEKRERSYAVMMPAEVRKRLSKDSPFRDQGSWSASQMLLLTVPPGQSFQERAQRLRKQYGLANEENWLYEDMRAMTEGLIKHGASISPGLTALPWFTSLGVLDGDVLLPEHGDLKIDYVTSWADGLAPGVVFRMYTFRGRLNVHLAYNSAYHSDLRQKETLDMTEDILQKELGMRLEIDEVRLMEY